MSKSPTKTPTACVTNRIDENFIRTIFHRVWAFVSLVNYQKLATYQFQRQCVYKNTATHSEVSIESYGRGGISHDKTVFLSLSRRDNSLPSPVYSEARLNIWYILFFRHGDMIRWAEKLCNLFALIYFVKQRIRSRCNIRLLYLSLELVSNDAVLMICIIISIYYESST